MDDNRAKLKQLLNGETPPAFIAYRIQDGKYLSIDDNTSIDIRKWRYQNPMGTEVKVTYIEHGL